MMQIVSLTAPHLVCLILSVLNIFQTNQAHTTHCPDCINTIMTLDEISQHIQKIINEDVAQEARCDFENASGHIIEWSRHNLRAVRQNAENKSIIT